MTQIPYVSRLVARPARREQAVATPGFTWAMIGLMAWFLAGLFIDGWAHSHGRVDQSFFTPWHAMFYSGWAATVGGLSGCMLLNRTRGYAWHRAVPVGYEWALTGAIVFAFGGAFDLVWHTLFGIEESVEALISPSHLLLACGMVLVMSSPIRAAWHATSSTTAMRWRDQLPLMLSITFTLSVLTFMTSYIHPYTRMWPLRWNSGDDGQALGIGGIMLQTAILQGFVLMAVRHWRLRWGSLTVVYVLNAALMTVFEDTYRMILVAAVSGLIADTLVLLLRPSRARPQAFRWFAVLAPVAMYSCYMLVLASSTFSMTWSTHLVTGAITLAGLTGLSLSLLVLPPDRPTDHARD